MLICAIFVHVIAPSSAIKSSKHEVCGAKWKNSLGVLSFFGTKLIVKKTNYYIVSGVVGFILIYTCINAYKNMNVVQNGQNTKHLNNLAKKAAWNFSISENVHLGTEKRTSAFMLLIFCWSSVLIIFCSLNLNNRYTTVFMHYVCKFLPSLLPFLLQTMPHTVHGKLQNLSWASLLATTVCAILLYYIRNIFCANAQFI